MVYKRGSVYWFRFEFRGERYQRSTRSRNHAAALQIEAKFRTQLALGEHGLTPQKPAPTFKVYSGKFTAYIRTNSPPGTVRFYEACLRRLLDFKPIADAHLNRIDEEVIENYKRFRRKTVTPTTVNRELATLSKALHLAMDVHKLITKIPKIRRLEGERQREFVLSADQEAAYLAVAHDDLRDFAILALDTGVRPGEGLALEWEDVFPTYIRIKQGKTKNARRNLKLSPRCRMMLDFRREMLGGHWVFPGNGGKHRSISGMELLHQIARDKARMEDGSGLPKDFVLHSLRHTFGTRLGESGAEPFTIMKIMGHASVTISQRYVHPTPETIERAFGRLDAMNKIMRGQVETETETAAKKG